MTIYGKRLYWNILAQYDTFEVLCRLSARSLKPLANLDIFSTKLCIEDILINFWKLNKGYSYGPCLQICGYGTRRDYAIDTYKA